MKTVGGGWPKDPPRYAIRPMGKLVWRGMQTFPKPPYLVLLKVEAAGEKRGKPAKVEAAVAHPDGYELTAIPVVAALSQYLEGSARRPGLWMMGHLVDSRAEIDAEKWDASLFPASTVASIGSNRRK